MPTRFCLTASSAAALFAVISGCGSDTKSDEQAHFETDPALLQAALEYPVLSCQRARLECRSDATDADGRAACNDELVTCLQTAADKAQATAAALGQCRDDARSCVTGGSDLSDCRSGYDTCTEAAFDDSEPTSDAGVDTDAGSDDSTSDVDAGSLGDLPQPGTPGSALPDLPGPKLDGGILANLPKPERCVIELRLCVFRSPSKAMECGDEARACLKP